MRTNDITTIYYIIRNNNGEIIDKFLDYYKARECCNSRNINGNYFRVEYFEPRKRRFANSDEKLLWHITKAELARIPNYRD